MASSTRRRRRDPPGGAAGPSRQYAKMSSLHHTTCFDMIEQEDVAISRFLAQDPENFVVGYNTESGLIFECQNLRLLKQQWRLPGNPSDRVPYKLFFECGPPNPDGFVPWQRLPGGRTFFQLGSRSFLTLKPHWIYEGPVPGPRIFILQPAGTVERFISNEFIPTLLPSTQENSEGMEKCNQLVPKDVFRLVAVDLDSLFDSDTEVADDEDDRDDDDEVRFVSTRRRTNEWGSEPILVLDGGYTSPFFGLRSLMT